MWHTHLTSLCMCCTTKKHLSEISLDYKTPLNSWHWGLVENKAPGLGHWFPCLSARHFDSTADHSHSITSAVEAQLTNRFFSFTLCDCLFFPSLSLFLPPLTPSHELSCPSLSFTFVFSTIQLFYLSFSFLLFIPILSFALYFPPPIFWFSFPSSFARPSLLHRPHSPHHRAAGLYSEALCTLWKIFPGVLQQKR